MGFSLVGNSGDQSTSTNIYETNYSASVNPQFELAGSGAGSVALDLSPLIQGGSLQDYNPNVSTAYAPINIVSAGSNLGDSALSTLAGIAANQTATSEAPGTTPTTLSSLFSGDSLYWVLGAIILLFVAHHGKGG